MNIIILIFSYLFYCFVCFLLIYSTDTAAIWNDKTTPRLHYFDLIEEDVLNIKNLSDYAIQSCMEDKIGPTYHYCMLIKEIEEYQSKHELSLEYIFLPLIFLLIIAKTIQSLFLISFAVSFLIVFVLAVATFLLINLLYERCTKFCLDSFEGIDYSVQHYNYLRSIKETVIFRYFVRRILSFIAFTIYLLFFFRIPE